MEGSVPDPIVTNLLDQLGSTKVYTKLDLRTGYYNVRVTAGHEWRQLPHAYGSFEFLVMPMDSPTLLLHSKPL